MWYTIWELLNEKIIKDIKKRNFKNNWKKIIKNINFMILMKFKYFILLIKNILLNFFKKEKFEIKKWEIYTFNFKESQLFGLLWWKWKWIVISRSKYNKNKQILITPLLNYDKKVKLDKEEQIIELKYFQFFKKKYLITPYLIFQIDKKRIIKNIWKLNCEENLKINISLRETLNI